MVGLLSFYLKHMGHEKGCSAYYYLSSFTITALAISICHIILGEYNDTKTRSILVIHEARTFYLFLLFFPFFFFSSAGNYM